MDCLFRGSIELGPSPLHTFAYHMLGAISILPKPPRIVLLELFLLSVLSFWSTIGHYIAFLIPWYVGELGTAIYNPRASCQFCSFPPQLPPWDTQLQLRSHHMDSGQKDQRVQDSPFDIFIHQMCWKVSWRWRFGRRSLYPPKFRLTISRLFPSIIVLLCSYIPFRPFSSFLPHYTHYVNEDHRLYLYLWCMLTIRIPVASTWLCTVHFFSMICPRRSVFVLNIKYFVFYPIPAAFLPSSVY